MSSFAKCGGEFCIRCLRTLSTCLSSYISPANDGDLFVSYSIYRSIPPYGITRVVHEGISWYYWITWLTQVSIIILLVGPGTHQTIRWQKIKILLCTWLTTSEPSLFHEMPWWATHHHLKGRAKQFCLILGRLMTQVENGAAQRYGWLHCCP